MGKGKGDTDENATRREGDRRCVRSEQKGGRKGVQSGKQGQEEGANNREKRLEARRTGQEDETITSRKRGARGRGSETKPREPETPGIGKSAIHQREEQIGRWKVRRER
uniref:Uncharacterized protein n=1 Tax=Knipowitschia caucasica TaxID=637954 RepID=A0AAV2J1W8_KNICA